MLPEALLATMNCAYAFPGQNSLPGTGKCELHRSKPGALRWAFSVALTLPSKPVHQKSLVTLRNWDPDVPIYNLFPVFILDKETAL